MKPVNQIPTKQTDTSLPARPPQLDPNRLIRLKEVLRLVPVAPSTWWGWVASGKAPSPIRLGQRCTCWRYADVIAMAGGEV